MSKNYDNWERLVAAVVQRERDKQMALSHSREPSSITGSSSFSSASSRFDHDQINLVHSQRSQILSMDYSDLALDHSQWKAMLLPDENQVVWSSASLGFSVDQGKNCFLVGATKLVLSLGEESLVVWDWGEESFGMWEMKSHPKSRFSEVAELIKSWFCHLQARIDAKMLSPETLYAAYLVFDFTGTYEKSHTVNSIIRVFHNESDYNSKKQDHVVPFQPTRNRRADGWMEIEMGNFYVHQDNTNGIIEVEVDGYMKSGLIVEGIEFRPLKSKKSTRPLKGKENTRARKKISSCSSSSSSSFNSTTSYPFDHDHYLVHSQRRQLPMDYSDLTLDHTQWKAMLPPDENQVVWRSASLGFSVDQGKNCFLVGATKLVLSLGEESLVVWDWGEESFGMWEMKSHPKSRFSEVAELRRSRFCHLQARIDAKMLSPETLYAAYLVFDFIGTYEELHTVNSIIRVFHNKSDYDSKKQDHVVHVQPTSNRRADGWMEIEMGDFYVYQDNTNGIIVEMDAYMKEGLIVEGIEFRPL